MSRKLEPSTLLEELGSRYPDLVPCLPNVARAFELLRASFSQGGKLLICGNGGSAADAEHIVGELMKGFKLKRPVRNEDRRKLVSAFPEDGPYLADHLQGALPAISLVSQSALLTAFANDVGADMVYAQQVYGYGRSNDVLLGISTSGDSKSVLNALRVARALGLGTLGLTGQSGGHMQTLCDVTVCAPFTEVFEIQERHLPIYHTLCLMLERAFFGAGEKGSKPHS